MKELLFDQNTVLPDIGCMMELYLAEVGGFLLHTTNDFLRSPRIDSLNVSLMSFHTPEKIFSDDSWRVELMLVIRVLYSYNELSFRDW